MSLDEEACFRAARARDARFDGAFFVCVLTTGIYCRPVCPARPPRRENMRFVPSAAAAQLAGFRPCLRCRPELSPDVAAWRGTESVVARALALIAEGGLDGGGGGGGGGDGDGGGADEGASVDALAERVGLGERQLRRLFERHLGASPVQVAQTRRLLFAKQLLQDTRLGMTEIALASGFGSVRRFNAVFRALYGRAPSTRRRGPTGAASGPRTPVTETVTLRLGYRPPYDWDDMLGFLAGRALPGVELVEAGRYLRTCATEAGPGTVEVRPGPRGQPVLLATLRVPALRALPGLVARLRRVFDLDADVHAIGAHLGRDPALARLVGARPGLRTPGGWDAFEQAVRGVLGQQVTVQAGRKLGGVLVELAGPRVAPALSGDARLSRLFPGPAELAAADLGGLGMPRARRATLHALAAAALADGRLLQRGGSLEDAVARLRGIAGFGEWTAQYVALRGLGHADAFPAGDVALQRSVDSPRRVAERQLLARAEAWRPWRGYAAQHLWTADAARRQGA